MKKSRDKVIIQTKPWRESRIKKQKMDASFGKLDHTSVLIYNTSCHLQTQGNGDQIEKVNIILPPSFDELQLSRRQKHISVHLTDLKSNENKMLVKEIKVRPTSVCYERGFDVTFVQTVRYGSRISHSNPKLNMRQSLDNRFPYTEGSSPLTVNGDPIIKKGGMLVENSMSSTKGSSRARGSHSPSNDSNSSTGSHRSRGKFKYYFLNDLLPVRASKSRSLSISKNNNRNNTNSDHTTSSSGTTRNSSNSANNSNSINGTRKQSDDESKAETNQEEK